MTLTESEVNTALRLRQLLTGDLLGAGIQSQEVRFRDGRITLAGTILEPLPGQLLVTMLPVIEGGLLQLNFENATLAGNEAPQSALDAADKAIGNTLREALENLPAAIQLLDVSAANGQLTIAGSMIEAGFHRAWDVPSLITYWC